MGQTRYVGTVPGSEKVAVKAKGLTSMGVRGQISMAVQMNKEQMEPQMNMEEMGVLRVLGQMEDM